MMHLLRPFLISVFLFILINGAFTTAVHNMPEFKQFVHAKVDNLLPRKLDQLAQSNPEKLDVLFMGTSQTNDGFSTDTFEEAFPLKANSFNLGLPGTGYGVMKTYLEHHIKHYGKPKLVLVEVSDLLAEPEDQHFYIPALQYKTLIEQDPSLFQSLWNSPFLTFNMRKEFILSYSSAIYQFRPLLSPIRIQSKIINIALDRIQLALEPFFPHGVDKFEKIQPAELPYSEEMTRKGWTPRIMSDMMLTRQGIEENARLALNYYVGQNAKVDLTNLSHFLNYCRSQQVPVVLVYWPNHPEYDKLFYKTDFYPAFKQGLYQMVSQYKVPLINLGKDRGAYITALFKDTRHLNVDGAIYFSKLLAKRLYELPQVRSALPNKEVVTVQKH